MPLPSRPVANTTIDSEWGQAVHDYTFAPSGGRCSGGAVTVTTLATLPIDTAIEDPGGFVDTAGNRFVIPTDKGGLYDLSLQANTVTGATTTKTRIYIAVNGTSIGQATDDNEGGTNVQIPLSRIRTLSAGDIVIAQAVKIGSGTSPSVSISEFTVVRRGSVLGA